MAGTGVTHSSLRTAPRQETAIVDTGSGSIMSTIFGQVTTMDKQCTFMPTIGSSVVRSVIVV
jgi:hypothetical protein